MSPFAFKIIQLLSKYNPKRVVNEPIESTDPAHVTVRLSPRWWETEDVRPVLVRVQALDIFKNLPSNYRYHLQVRVEHGDGGVSVFPARESSLHQGYLNPTRSLFWVFCKQSDSIRLVISHPGSGKKMSWIPPFTRWNPYLQIWSGPGHLGDGHTEQLVPPRYV